MGHSFYRVTTSEGGTALIVQDDQQEPPANSVQISEASYTAAVTSQRTSSLAAVADLVETQRALGADQAESDYTALVTIGVSSDLASRLTGHTT